MQNKVQITVIAHKPYAMPLCELYLPLHVGAEGKENIGFTQDNTGDNISVKNPYFCELTGLYWAWKNLDCDYLGLVHYRRYLAGKMQLNVNGKNKGILSEEELDRLLGKTDIVLPKKRNYFIENLYSHYAHTMYVEPLDIVGQIIAEKCPEYTAEFNRLKKRKTAHMFNIFVMKKDKLDAYCTWLFDILFELEKRVDAKKYDAFHARFYGRVSELLLDVWINTNRLNYAEIKVVNIEKVNWWKKGISFLKAKFGGNKYEGSF